ncbi:hypothetical protein FACS1894170_05050 [Planctomycetales bacterium]|nr:hypothetical protein FACS1894170_05050 [Planctomycetales bacterium]
MKKRKAKKKQIPKVTHRGVYKESEVRKRLQTVIKFIADSKGVPMADYASKFGTSEKVMSVFMRMAKEAQPMLESRIGLIKRLQGFVDQGLDFFAARKQSGLTLFYFTMICKGNDIYFPKMYLLNKKEIATRDRIGRMYLAGQYQAEIAHAVGLSRQRIGMLIHSIGLDLAYRGQIKDLPDVLPRTIEKDGKLVWFRHYVPE